jgi:uridine kinase
MIMDSIHDLKEKLVALFKLHTPASAFTVAISGIDASGKGHVGKLLQQQLEKKGYKVANINIDPWQNPLPVRLRKENAAQNVYENIFRWNDFFGQLIFPLQKNKSIYLETEGIRSDADVFYPLIYDYKGIDILLIEGIFLFKKKYRFHYDYKIWVDCSFETGLRRAIRRNAENLSEEQLVHDYQTFYYPAQRLHFERDKPKENANIIFTNE